MDVVGSNFSNQRTGQVRNANHRRPQRPALIETLESRSLFSALPGTYHLSFDDEFNGSSLNLSKYTSQGWEASPGTFGWLSRDSGNNPYYSGEGEYYANPSQGQPYNPYTVSNGVLSMTAQNTSMAGMTSVTSQPEVSGEITSAQGGEQYNFGKGFSQTYGYFETRCEVPSGAGMWPAFWLLPEPNLNTNSSNATNSGAEYDVFEIPVNSTTQNGVLNPREIQQTAHYWKNGSYTATGSTYTMPVVNGVQQDASTAFHTYGLEWDANSIRWYVDGVLTSTQTFAAGTWNTPMYILANLAIGNSASSWPGVPTSPSEFPQSFNIDYLRVYSDSSSVPEITPQANYSVNPDTLDAISVDPEPATAGAIFVGLIYLAGRRPIERDRHQSLLSLT